MVLSWNIANLLSKEISTVAVALEMYGYGTEPEHCEFAEQSNQHCSCCTRGV